MTQYNNAYNIQRKIKIRELITTNTDYINEKIIFNLNLFLNIYFYEGRLYNRNEVVTR